VGYLSVQRLLRSLSLSQRFLIVAVIVIALAMALLGAWIGRSLQASVAEGVATTAADTIESLIEHQFKGMSLDDPLSSQDQARLEEIFTIANDFESARLLQIRIFGLDGRVVFSSVGPLTSDPKTSEVRETASSGKVSAKITTLELGAVGPVTSHPIEVLQIFAPLHADDANTVAAVAELYYSTKSLLAIEWQTQLSVWTVVALIGAGLTGVLYLFVGYASKTITRQRERLASNLTSSRALLHENQALKDASDALRASASIANESLLARVGSDIHDGPIQLLTLIILRLTKTGGRARSARTGTATIGQTTIALATQAINDLRNISVGLVLPELEARGIEATMKLAIERHEGLTGVAVTREFSHLPEEVSAEIKVCAYRVLQEGLNNAFRHGEPNGQVVKAFGQEGMLVIQVSNPVRNIESASPDGNAIGLGLRGMRFRVESLGGTLEVAIGSSPIVTVEARIPYGSAGALSKPSEDSGTPANG